MNKAIFDDPAFRNCQCAFAAFHFFVTAFTLYVLSRPFFGLFVPMHLRIRTMLPLASAMCLNIVLMNVSLAISTITFYQIARILLTPATVLLNFLFYRKTIPRNATLSLIPMCIGVGIITYYEPKPGTGSKVASVGFVTVAVAVISVFASAVYTVWISYYQRKYDINGFQLLYNQAPIGGVMLLYVIPWTDKFPAFDIVPGHKWAMILLVCSFNPLSLKHAKLNSLIEWVFCILDQPLPILHHRWGRPGEQHRGRPCKNMLYCGSRLDHKWARCCRPEYLRRDCCHW